MKLLLSLFAFLIFSFTSTCQTAATLQELEAIFLKNNLVLLGEQLNIEASKAAIIQARLWENPYFNAEINARNPQDGKFFDAGQRGQKAFAIQQLIYLGGKKKKEVDLAKTNAELAEIAFQDVLRNIRFQLRTTFFELYYNTISAEAFQKQLNNLDTLVQAYTVQAQKGNIPLKDVVRLQALYISIKNEHTSLLNNIIEQQSRLNLITSTQNKYTPNPDTKELAAYNKQLSFSVEGLQAEAIAHRPDIAMAGKSIEAARMNLLWQRSLAVPDVVVGSSYDQRGGAFNNQVNLTLGVPLRLWNRNQGNIKVAEVRSNQAFTEKQQLLIQLNAEVEAAYKKYLVAKSNYAMLNGTLSNNFDLVYNGMYQNFQKRNVSLIEFTDFMESYNQSIIKFNQIKKSLVHACEEINYSTGSNIF